MPEQESRVPRHAQCNENKRGKHNLKPVLWDGMRCSNFVECEFDATKKKPKMWFCENQCDCFFCPGCKEDMDKAWKKQEQEEATRAAGDGMDMS